MSKKRIAIVGKGTAGSLSTAHMVKAFPDHEIQWYFDLNKPVQSVGEGSTLTLPQDLNKNLSFFFDDVKKIGGTFKVGILKENWGNAEKSFMHNFAPPGVAMHFSASDLQGYAYDRLKDKVTIIDQDVDFRNLDADFILNASGTPQNFDDYQMSEYLPVNAAHVVQCYWDRPAFEYTLAIAGRHGWIFGIPLQNRLSIGYIYNKNINNVDDLQDDINEICAKYGVVQSERKNNLSFNNYIKKNNYEDGGRIAYNGNASFFLEPLEATSFAVTSRVYHDTESVWKQQISSEEANETYLKILDRIETFIMLHYAAGSVFDTPFWRMAQELGIKKIEKLSNDKDFHNIYRIAKNRILHNVFPTIEEEIKSNYGGWSSLSYEENIRGLGLMPLLDRITQV